MSASTSCRRFSLEEIQSATQDFHDKLCIGKGGFGKVYKGQIVSEGQGLVVAIKRLDSMSNQGGSEFRTEIEMLSKLHHCHLVSLIGYCDDNKEMILVYEYMRRGTLYHHLHKPKTPLNWMQRMNIAIGAGRGLDYLHTGVGTHHGIIHRDVKSSNILLDEKLNALISDFGLSRIGPTNQSISFLEASVKGTFGYLDPDYFYTRRLTRKTDVYAFGIVLFELLSGRLPVDIRYGEDYCSLVRWAQKCLKERKLDQMVDSNIKGTIFPKCLRGFAKIAGHCLHSVPKERPTMTEVVASLQALLQLQIKSASSSGLTGFTWKIHKYLVSETKPISGKTMDIGTAESLQSDFSTIKDATNDYSEENKLGQDEFGAVYRGTLKDGQEIAIKRLAEISSIGTTEYNFSTIKEATNDFFEYNKIGSGGFGAVYKGTLGDGQEIAVKRLARDSYQGDVEFKNEVLLAAKLQHRNLVRLLGFSKEGNERLIIYEFLTNASLDRFIFDPTKRTLLVWEKRYNIIKGIANGLLYLHEDSRLRIIHRDMKASNVFLDAQMNPKIAYFGMARLSNREEYQGDTSRIAGTCRYMAPEYAMHGQFSVKSDVFSFGVLVLEMVTGQKNQRFQSGESIEDLLGFAWKSWKNGTTSDMIDPNLTTGSGSLRDIIKSIHIGLLCVQENVFDRPTMAAVVLMLNSSFTSLTMPSKPAYFMDSNSDLQRWNLKFLVGGPKNFFSHNRREPA